MVKQATSCWKKKPLIRRDASQLHNNVGALLLQRGAVEDATRHFHSAIQHADGQDEAAGLAWFHRKLLAEQQHGVAEQLFVENTEDEDDDVDEKLRPGNTTSRVRSNSMASVAQQPRRGCLVRSTSSGCCNNNISWRGNLTTETGMPVCCDGSTPLGLEYYAFPISVSSESGAASASAAAWLNLAALQYPKAKSNDELQETLELLHKAAAANNNVIENNNVVLSAIRDSNEGVILFRLSQTKEALVCFERAARVVLESEAAEFRILLAKNNDKDDDWNANPQYEYLRITILLNHARTSVRLNDTKTATDMCRDIASCSDTLLHNNSHKDHHHHHLNNMTSLVLNRVRWISIVANMYVMGMIHQRKNDLPEALECYTHFLSKARHDLGHDHLHVATVLYMKGNILFEQRKLHHAMLAQLAALKIHESQHFASSEQQNPSHFLRDMARVMYSVSRTLHDREEYRDALRMYQRTLEIQKSLKLQDDVDVVTTMCNIARVYHIMGDLQACLVLNKQIVRLAQEMAGAEKKHPFVADRFNVLGNVMVEAGQLPQAMEAFAAAARAGSGNDVTNVYDVDAQSAASLAKAGLQHPGAATA